MAPTPRRSGLVLAVALWALAACGDDTPGGGDADGGGPGADSGAVDGGGGDGGAPDAGPFPFTRCEPGAPMPALIEDRTVYDQDDPTAVVDVEVEILDADAFAAVNAGVEDATAPVIFRAEGVGQDATTANATIKIRGGASRVNVQKNYKVELTEDGLRWRGQREINLNKHMWDLTRLRNKLSFDLFRTIEHFTSLRTGFVRLAVDGDDYGLFTWVEEPDKRFLAAHGLDPDGTLYKAVNFFFQPLEPGEVTDPVALDLVIDDKANADLDKLQRMLAAVADDTIDPLTLVDTYFNRENLVTWVAINVLLNDIDSLTQNFYLYSPSSCEGWAFLPWDYDGAWGFYGQLATDDRKRWERGLSAWWPSHLFRRVFTAPAIADAIHARIAELASGELDDAEVAARIETYRATVEPFVARSPDFDHLPGVYGSGSAENAIEVWGDELARVATTTSRFHAEYLAVLERPMPMFVAFVPGSPHEFRWDRSFDLQGDPLTYDLEVSRSSGFGTLVEEQTDLTDNDTTVATLPSGTLYWRVIARDGKSSDSWQLPIDPYKRIVLP